MGNFHQKKKKKGHRNQRERETDRVPSCKNSHPRLNKQGCKWENDDTIQLHKFIIKKKKKKEYNHERDYHDSQEQSSSST